MSGAGDMVVSLLVQLGIPAAVFAAIGSAWTAFRKRRAMLAAAPDLKIDTSMSRMAQAAIMQDGVIDNMRDALKMQTGRAEAAERRAAAAERRVVELEKRVAKLEAVA